MSSAMREGDACDRPFGFKSGQVQRFFICFALTSLAVLIFAPLVLLNTAAAQTPTVTVVSTSPPPDEPPPNGTSAAESLGSTADNVTDAIAARTPIPTPTPGIVQREVAEITQTFGLDSVLFLGLTADDWINLGLSALIFVICYWVAFRILDRFLHRLVRHTQTHFDDEFLDSIDHELKWAVGLLILRFSFLRLDFLSDGLRTLLNDAFFILGLLVIVRIVIKLIDFGLDWYEAKIGNQKHGSVIDPAIMMIKHASKLLVYVTGVSIGLSHFGLTNNVISIVLIAIGLVALLSVKDVMTDVIYGFIILVGQPFREGDAIHIEGMPEGEWGRVTEIGSRDTRIRTLDNRTLVVPNADLGAGQVVNYTDPDPTYRVQTDLHVVYGSDFSQIQSVLEKAAHEVEGVLPDKPIEVIFLQFGTSGRTVRVRWWIASCERDVEMIGLVNAALETALAAAKIEIAYTVVDLNVTKSLNDTTSEPI